MYLFSLRDRRMTSTAQEVEVKHAKLFKHTKCLQMWFYGQLPATLISFTIGFVFAIRDTLHMCTYFPFFAVFSQVWWESMCWSMSFLVVFVIYDQIYVIFSVRSLCFEVPDTLDHGQTTHPKFICPHMACCPSHRYPTDVTGLWSLVKEHSSLYGLLLQALKHSVDTASVPLFQQ